MTARPLPDRDEIDDCEICERTGPRRRHPCRFERACACWYSVACDPPGATMAAMTRAGYRHPADEPVPPMLLP